MAIWGRLCLAWCCVLVTLYYYISESLHLHGIRGKEPKNMFGLRGKSAEKSSSGSALLRKTAAGMMPRDHHILHKKCKSDRLSTAMLSEELAEDNVGINGAVLESYRDFLEEGHAPDTHFFEYVANHCDLPRSTPVVVDTDTNETATIADVKDTGMKIFAKVTAPRLTPEDWRALSPEEQEAKKKADQAERRAEAIKGMSQEQVAEYDAREARREAKRAEKQAKREASKLPKEEWDAMTPLQKKKHSAKIKRDRATKKKNDFIEEMSLRENIKELVAKVYMHEMHLGFGGKVDEGQHNDAKQMESIEGHLRNEVRRLKKRITMLETQLKEIVDAKMEK